MIYIHRLVFQHVAITAQSRFIVTNAKRSIVGTAICVFMSKDEGASDLEIMGNVEDLLTYTVYWNSLC